MDGNLKILTHCQDHGLKDLSMLQVRMDHFISGKLGMSKLGDRTKSNYLNLIIKELSPKPMLNIIKSSYNKSIYKR